MGCNCACIVPESIASLGQGVARSSKNVASPYSNRNVEWAAQAAGAGQNRSSQHFTQRCPFTQKRLRCSFIEILPPSERQSRSLPLSRFIRKAADAPVARAVNAPSAETSDISESALQLGRSAAPRDAAEVVRSFYSSINKGDIDLAMSFIAEDCRYEDMIYKKPFVGRQAIRAFFEEQTSFFKDGLDFVIDEISGGSSDSCGLTWHVEFQGKVFPNSRGCSYYRCAVGADGKQQIVYGRDMVESALKPGSASLVLLRVVAALFKRFPKLLDVASVE